MRRCFQWAEADHPKDEWFTEQDRQRLTRMLWDHASSLYFSRCYALALGAKTGHVRRSSNVLRPNLTRWLDLMEEE